MHSNLLIAMTKSTKTTVATTTTKTTITKVLELFGAASAASQTGVLRPENVMGFCFFQDLRLGQRTADV